MDTLKNKRTIKQKRIDFSSLPRRKTGTQIDWKNSVGCECEFQYGDVSGVLIIEDYKLTKNSSSIVKLRYNDKSEWIQISHLKNGQIGNLIGQFTHDFKFSVGDILDTKSGKIEILNRMYKKMDDRDRKMYDVKCLVCGSKYQTQEIIIANGSGCPVCAGLQVSVGINDIPTTDPWMIPYFQGGVEEAKKYTHSSTKKIYPICPICGTVKNTAMKIGTIYQNHSISCNCNREMSFPENVMFNLLDQFHIPFIFQFTKKNADWVGNYRYDFYLPTSHTIIETNGDQHFNKPIYKKKTVEMEQLNDKNKKDLALNNGISNYFEIDCSKSNSQYIIQSSAAAGLLEFLGIDISQIDIQQLNELVMKKEIEKIEKCIKEYPYITRQELSIILGISRSKIDTVCKLKNLHIKYGQKTRLALYSADGELVDVFSQNRDGIRKLKSDYNISLNERNVIDYKKSSVLLDDKYYIRPFKDLFDASVKVHRDGTMYAYSYVEV